jgi:peptidylprolyl isomerase
VIRRIVPAVALAAALVLSACGSSSEPEEDFGSVPSPTGGVTVTGELGSKPTVTVSEETAAVSELVISDIDEGTGDPVEAGATVTVHYVGVGGSTGQEFDSSWDRGQTIQFPLSGVIKGWQDGIPGMRPGGRRLLVIPGDEAYGANPPPGSGIQPNENLVFVVDLVSSP